MHEVEQNVPELPPELANDPYVWRAHNLHTVEPVHLPLPPEWLQKAIDTARAQARAGNAGDAQRTLDATLDPPHLAKEFGEYRERLIWCEAHNARRLVTLATAWDQLQRAGDLIRQQLAVRCEGFAYDRYGLQELRTERGWAERVTRKLAILPAAWRVA